MLILACACLPSFARIRPTSAAEPWLRVSDNQRFFVQADGTPFFYLADTAWELFHRLNREQASQYLENRAARGFTVIQAVVLAELDGLHDPNPYGHRPLVDNDPTHPDVRDGSGNDYFDHVDFVVGKANALGLAIGMLPTWGDKWNKKWGVGPRSLHRKMLKSTDDGLANATRIIASFGFWVVTARSKPTCIAK